MKLPYRSRDPSSFKDVAAKLLTENAECPGYTLDCSSWKRVYVKLVKRRVRDRLSGLTLTLRIPVIVFEGEDGECRVEVNWDGEFYKLDCRALEECCERKVTRGP